MKRPVSIEVIAWASVISVIAVLLQFYRAALMNTLAKVPLFPGSPFPVDVQWVFFGAFTLVGLINSIGLLNGWKWARWSFLTVFAAGLILFSIGASWHWFVMSVGSIFFNAISLAILFGKASSQYFDASERITFRAGLRSIVVAAPYAFAVFGIFLTMISLFDGTMPYHPVGPRKYGTNVVMVAFVSFMLLGAAFRWDRARAAREMGVILIAVAIFLPVPISAGLIYVWLTWPTVPVMVDWRHLLAWLLALGISGAALVWISGRWAEARLARASGDA